MPRPNARMTGAPVDRPQLGRTHETVACVARNWNFESTSLQERVRCELDAAAASVRYVNGFSPAWRPGGQWRLARSVNRPEYGGSAVDAVFCRLAEGGPLSVGHHAHSRHCRGAQSLQEPNPS